MAVRTQKVLRPQYCFMYTTLYSLLHVHLYVICPTFPPSVKLHATNVGLVSQWLNVWIPASDHEAAFILEDDMEVSPYFFVWAVRAAEKYYIRDTAQQTLHAQLLDAVEKITESDGMKLLFF